MKTNENNARPASEKERQKKINRPNCSRPLFYTYNHHPHKQSVAISRLVCKSKELGSPAPSQAPRNPIHQTTSSFIRASSCTLLGQQNKANIDGMATSQRDQIAIAIIFLVIAIVGLCWWTRKRIANFAQRMYANKIAARDVTESA